ncbi:FIST C-terminal domain-containing protein [Patescibacteria group bacterium]|nr:FIST C-terminal domain-containing protein [Patescibacteria group bacterium]MBU2219577.1 FIST C-terminal domain-containing protein [Patescibacteria group bacterium]MBU2265303.1 FIST C-terminal domain-containing protein [Patescibacteria group bacterium]
MKIEQKKWTTENGWKTLSSNLSAESPELVLVFGGNTLLKDKARFDEVRSWYPQSHIISASTAGEIIKTEVSDDTLVLTAIKFAQTALQFAEVSITQAEESEMVGKKLAQALPKEELVHVMIFSDGLFVNGTTLVKGLLSELPKEVSVTGGLVGDGTRFKETLVGLDKMPEQKKLVCVGFYGSSIKIGYGSLGGWDSFGISRTITKSKGNVLYELDEKPALALYKEYLGELAKDLPASGLLFPLSLKVKTDIGGEVEVVRTILAVDEKAQSMTFAGDMPEGTVARSMKANFDRLVDGASGAAGMSIESLGQGKAELAILISCIGRKLVLKERIEEEIEAVQEKIGPQATIIGFYSYGEISPTTPTERQCQLHNQTMTITTFREE